MMTRKHFKLFAEAIGRIPQAEQREAVTRTVAAVCRSSNTRFDYGRFQAAIEKAAADQGDCH